MNRSVIATVLALCMASAGCSHKTDTQPVLPMRYRSAVVHVTYHTPIRSSYAAPVAENSRIADSNPPQYRGVMVQTAWKEDPTPPGRVVWEFAGTVDKGDVYVVQILADSSSTNATVLPVIYAGKDLIVHDDETLTISITESREANK